MQQVSVLPVTLHQDIEPVSTERFGSMSKSNKGDDFARMVERHLEPSQRETRSSADKSSVQESERDSRTETNTTATTSAEAQAATSDRQETSNENNQESKDVSCVAEDGQTVKVTTATDNISDIDNVKSDVPVDAPEEEVAIDSIELSEKASYQPDALLSFLASSEQVLQPKPLETGDGITDMKETLPLMEKHQQQPWTIDLNGEEIVDDNLVDTDFIKPAQLVAETPAVIADNSNLKQEIILPVKPTPDVSPLAEAESEEAYQVITVPELKLGKLKLSPINVLIRDSLNGQHSAPESGQSAKLTEINGLTLVDKENKADRDLQAASSSDVLAQEQVSLEELLLMPEKQQLEVISKLPLKAQQAILAQLEAKPVNAGSEKYTQLYQKIEQLMLQQLNSDKNVTEQRNVDTDEVKFSGAERIVPLINQSQKMASVTGSSNKANIAVNVDLSERGADESIEQLATDGEKQQVKGQGLLSAEKEQGQLFSQALQQAVNDRVQLNGASDGIDANNDIKTQAVEQARRHEATQLSQLKEAIIANPKDLAVNVKDKVLMMMQHKTQQLEIRLDPAELGKMQIKLNMQNDQAVVHIVVQSQQTKDMLDQNLTRLKDLLQDQGIDLGDANIEQQSQQEKQHAQETNGNGKSLNDSNELSDEEFIAQAQVINAQSIKASATGIDYYA